MPLPDVEGRHHDAVGLEPLEGEHGADDVDDRVERADLVEVHLIHRHLVDARLGLGQAPKQGDGAIPRGWRERGLRD